MFDTRAMATGHARNLAVELDERADSATRRAELRLVGERVTPMALAASDPSGARPACSAVPRRGVAAGSIVGIRGSGATSLAMAVAAGPSTSGAWTAVVGDLISGWLRSVNWEWPSNAC